MNLRILKKLSKRAAPLLIQLGDHRKQFPAATGENYSAHCVNARKHFERSRSRYGDRLIHADGSTVHPARDGHGGFIYMRRPSHPRKGTIMVGAVSGYYEPEWDEETAWHALNEVVYWNFVPIDKDGELGALGRSLDTPSQVFRAAADMIAAATNQ